MKTSKVIGFLGILLGIGCVSLTVSDNSICDSKSLSFPIPQLPIVDMTQACSQVSAVIPSVSATQKFDFSDPVKKVSDLTDQLSISITQLVIDNSSGVFSWISGVDVQVSGNNLQQMDLASYTVPPTGMSSEINVDVHMSPADILRYLKSGPITLTITLEGGTVNACEVEKLASMTSISSGVNMCVAVSANVNKSLL